MDRKHIGLVLPRFLGLRFQVPGVRCQDWRTNRLKPYIQMFGTLGSRWQRDARRYRSHGGRPYDG